MSSVIKSDIHYQEHTGELTHKQTQPTEDIILNRNAELRKNPGALRDLGQGEAGGSWGRQVACIPVITWDRAIRDGYDIANKDADVAGMEMNRFLQTVEGQKCLVQATKRGH